MKKERNKLLPMQTGFLVGMTIMLSACVTTQGPQAGSQLGEALGKVIAGPANATSKKTESDTGDARKGIRSIKESELMGIFDHKPLQMNNGHKAQYPRVAITVDDSFMDQFKLPRPSQCYFMHARIWDSSTKSRPIAPFSVCGNDIQEPPGGFLRADNRLAAWNSGIAAVGEDHTGSTRTEGPRYPQRPLPSGPLDAVGVAPTDISYYFIHGTLTAMNFDFTQPDPRVWFVKFGKLSESEFKSWQASAAHQVGTTPTTTTMNDTMPAANTAGTVKLTSLSPMTYATMIKIISDARGNTQTIRQKLIGRSIQLTLKAPGPNSLVVDAADEIYFSCAYRDSGFKGGKVTSNITGYEYSEGEGNPVIILESCSSSSKYQKKSGA